MAEWLGGATWGRAMRNQVLLTGAAFGIGACGGGPEEVSSRRVQELPELPISVEIAEAATIRFDDPGADFVLVYVTYNGEQFGIYAGNAPNTPHDPASSPDIAGALGARYPVHCVTSAGDEGEPGHCLVDLRARLDYPWYLHFFYEDFEPESVAEVQAVIASTEVLESEGI
jgi:hypothetical protein